MTSVLLGLLQCRPMAIFSLTPSHFCVSIDAEHFARPVGVITVGGTGQLAGTTLELFVDLAALGALEAAIGEARQKLCSMADC